MQKDKNTQAGVTKTEKQPPRPFFFFGLPFGSKKVVVEFIVTSLLIVAVPILIVLNTQSYLKDYPGLSQAEKTAYSIVPSVIWINIMIGIYVYRVVKDSENYQRDPPLVIGPKKTKNE